MSAALKGSAAKSAWLHGPSVEFQSLAIGDLFAFDGYLYIRVDPTVVDIDPVRGRDWAICLGSLEEYESNLGGRAFFFTPNESVTRMYSLGYVANPHRISHGPN